MRGRYTLEWLDSLINISLNPNKTDIAAMTDAEVKSVIYKIGKEKDKQQTILKDHIFGSTKEKHIELLLKQYHSTLIILLDQVLENVRYIPSESPQIRKLMQELIDCLDELLSFIEIRFSGYLSQDERVPITYLSVINKEFKQRLGKLKPKIADLTSGTLAGIILESFNILIDRKEHEPPITFHELYYKKELLRELENLSVDEHGHFRDSDLNALLVYMNFNSRSYINYYALGVTEKINMSENLSDKLEKLLFHLKEFNQMRRKPDVVLHPQYGDLQMELNNWFNHEIFYLEKKIHFLKLPANLKPEQISTATPTQKQTHGQNQTQNQTQKQTQNQKVLCALSVDQLALIIKSAVDVEIILSTSLNKVFKAIVPHLSTHNLESLSPDSMRSKSYSPEDRDKELVIQVLEQMTNTIRAY